MLPYETKKDLKEWVSVKRKNTVLAWGVLAAMAAFVLFGIIHSMITEGFVAISAGIVMGLALLGLIVIAFGWFSYSIMQEEYGPNGATAIALLSVLVSIYWLLKFIH